MLLPQIFQRLGNVVGLYIHSYLMASPVARVQSQQVLRQLLHPLLHATASWAVLRAFRLQLGFVGPKKRAGRGHGSKGSPCVSFLGQLVARDELKVGFHQVQKGVEEELAVPELLQQLCKAMHCTERCMHLQSRLHGQRKGVAVTDMVGHADVALRTQLDAQMIRVPDVGRVAI